MKIVLFILLNCFPILLIGQLLPEVLKYSGNIETAVQKEYGKINSVYISPQGKKSLVGEHYGYSGIKRTLYFNTSGQIEKRVTYWGKDLYGAHTYTRDTIGNIFFLKTKYSTIQPFLPGATEITEMELNDNSLPISMKNYFEPAISDTTQRFTFENNAIYSNNLIQSYNYFELNYKRDTLNSSIIEIEYNENNQISTMTERTNGYTSYYKPNPNTGKKMLVTEIIPESNPIKVYKYSYDQKGKLAMLTIQFLAEHFTAEERANVSKMTYEYDKKGNWTGIYTQDSGLRILITDQKIKYRK